MRSVLDGVAMDGIVVIGEGEKDEAPMLFNGERIGNGNPPETDIAVDPIDGTTLTALGRGNAIAVIAVADRRLRRAQTFSDLPPGEAFWYENANGLAEIAVNQGRAAERLGLAVGMEIEVLDG